jgi:hypothetical protein
MQPFVESVFVVVASLITTLLVGGLSGIIILLTIDTTKAPRLTRHEAAVDHGADHRSARGSSAGPTHATALRTSS